MNGLKVAIMWEFLVRSKVPLKYKAHANFIKDSAGVIHSPENSCVDKEKISTFESINLDLNALRLSKACIKKNCVSLVKSYPTLKDEIRLLQILSRIAEESQLNAESLRPSLKNFSGPKSYLEQFEKETKAHKGYSVERDEVIEKFNLMLLRDRALVEEKILSVKRIEEDKVLMKEYIVTSEIAPIAVVRKALGLRAGDNSVQIKDLDKIVSEIERMEPTTLSQFRDESFQFLDREAGSGVKEWLIKGWRVDIKRLISELPKTEEEFINGIEGDKRSFIVDMRRPVEIYQDDVILSLKLRSKWKSRVVITDALSAAYLRAKYNLEIAPLKPDISKKLSEDLVELASVLIEEQEEGSNLKIALERSRRLLDA